MGWKLLNLNQAQLAAVEAMGFKSPEDLRRKNKKLYCQFRDQAIKGYYERLSAGRYVKKEWVRKLLAAVYDLSIERINGVLYNKKGGSYYEFQD